MGRGAISQKSLSAFLRDVGPQSPWELTWLQNFTSNTLYRERYIWWRKTKSPVRRQVNQLLAENIAHLSTNPRLLLLQQERSQIFYPGSCQGLRPWRLWWGWNPIYLQSPRIRPFASQKRTLLLQMWTWCSPSHVMDWPLKCFTDCSLW